eukprot:jgi/Hompol1/1303/HPOL_005554-RA
MTSANLANITPSGSGSGPGPGYAYAYGYGPGYGYGYVPGYGAASSRLSATMAGSNVSGADDSPFSTAASAVSIVRSRSLSHLPGRHGPSLRLVTATTNPPPTAATRPQLPMHRASLQQQQQQPPLSPTGTAAQSDFLAYYTDQQQPASVIVSGVPDTYLDPIEEVAETATQYPPSSKSHRATPSPVPSRSAADNASQHASPSSNGVDSINAVMDDAKDFIDETSRPSVLTASATVAAAAPAAEFAEPAEPAEFVESVQSAELPKLQVVDPEPSAQSEPQVAVSEDAIETRDDSKAAQQPEDVSATQQVVLEPTHATVDAETVEDPQLQLDEIEAAAPQVTDTHVAASKTNSNVQSETRAASHSISSAQSTGHGTRSDANNSQIADTTLDRNTRAGRSVHSGGHTPTFTDSRPPIPPHGEGEHSSGSAHHQPAHLEYDDVLPLVRTETQSPLPPSIKSASERSGGSPHTRSSNDHHVGSQQSDHQQQPKFTAFLNSTLFRSSSPRPSRRSGGNTTDQHQHQHQQHREVSARGSFDEQQPHSILTDPTASNQNQQRSSGIRFFRRALSPSSSSDRLASRSISPKARQESLPSKQQLTLPRPVSHPQTPPPKSPADQRRLSIDSTPPAVNVSLLSDDDWHMFDLLKGIEGTQHERGGVSVINGGREPSRHPIGSQRFGNMFDTDPPVKAPTPLRYAVNLDPSAVTGDDDEDQTQSQVPDRTQRETSPHSQAHYAFSAPQESRHMLNRYLQESSIVIRPGQQHSYHPVSSVPVAVAAFQNSKLASGGSSSISSAYTVSTARGPDLISRPRSPPYVPVAAGRHMTSSPPPLQQYLYSSGGSQQGTRKVNSWLADLHDTPADGSAINSAAPSPMRAASPLPSPDSPRTPLSIDTHPSALVKPQKADSGIPSTLETPHPPPDIVVPQQPEPSSLADLPEKSLEEEEEDDVVGDLAQTKMQLRRSSSAIALASEIITTAPDDDITSVPLTPYAA